MQDQFSDGFVYWSGWPTDNKYHIYTIYRFNKEIYFYLDKEFIGKGSSAGNYYLGTSFGLFCIYPNVGDPWPLKGWVKDFSFYVNDIEGLIKGNSLLYNNIKT